MALGIVCGLFWGEDVAWLGPVGTGYIKLLQMTILPYIIASLTVGIGSLSYDQARQVAVKVCLLTLAIWAVGFLLFFAMPVVFPDMKTAAFFSDVTIAPPKQIDYFAMYIPSNPFHSMSSNAIPAVVLFCLAIGIALIGIEDKARLIDPLKTVSAALSKVTNGIVALMPYGVFAITAASAGTLSIDEFEKLQVYIWIHVVASLLLSFLILPLLVTSFTRFRYLDVVTFSKDALVTAFVTGNLFVILPVLTENAKELFKKYDLYREKPGEYVDIVIPVSFNFPNLGKISTFLFVLFAVWFSGGSLRLGDYPFLLFGGILTMFGSVNVAIPFLLDGVRVPSDLFQLFVVSGVISGKFSTLLAAMNLLAITLGSTALLTGVGKIQWRRLCFAALACVCIVAATLVATRQVLVKTVNTAYQMDEVLLNMQVATKLHDKSSQATEALAPQGYTPQPDATAADIITRGTLRVGLVEDNLPFAYHNNQDELVGFDIDLMKLLATEMGVKVEFVHYQSDEELFNAVNSGLVDICASGLYVTAPSLAQVRFSQPVFDLTMALVTRDHRKAEFENLEALAKKEHARIAYQKLFPGMPAIMARFPGLEFVKVDSNSDYFEDDENYDALMINLEAGMAWTLLYPDFTAIFYKATRFPMAYAVGQNNSALQDFLSSWLTLKKTMGAVDTMSSYWIKGENAKPRQPRWSIARDVLGWKKD